MRAFGIAGGKISAVPGRPYLTHQTRRTAGAWCGVAGVWLFFGLTSPPFFTTANLTNILLQSSSLMILAAGLTVVIITGEFDLSIAALEALAGAIAAVLVIEHGAPLFVGILAALAASAGAGLVSGLAIAKLGIPSFVATLAMLGIAQGGAFLMTGGNPVLGFPSGFNELGQGRIHGVPVALIVAIGVLGVMEYVLIGTRTGRHIFAVGGNREAAVLAGIRVGRVKINALIISGLLSGMAGLILASRLNSGDGRNGSADLLNAIAAVVIAGTSLFGGAGSMIATAAGVITVQSIYNGMILLNVGQYWNQVVLGLAILCAVMMDQVVTGSGPLGGGLPGLAGRLRRTAGTAGRAGGDSKTGREQA